MVKAEKKYLSYDIHGNVDTLLQDYGNSTGSPNAMNTTGNRFKKITYEFDLISGKVNAVNYQPNQADAFYHRYSYDAENRLIDVETSSDKIVWERDARYNYYRHGALARTVLGQNQVQGIDYAYNLQGQLKGINSTNVGDGIFDMGQDGKVGSSNSNIARDVYGIALNYFNGDYKPVGLNTVGFSNPFAGIAVGNDLFNGNIKSQVVNIPKIGDALTYAYGYDQLNRLTKMDAYNGLNNASNVFTPISIQDYKERLTYDPNGNIKTYLRNGTGATLNLNNYSYTYTAGTNKLASIANAVNAQTKSYVYDEVGNTTTDGMQGITNAVWNVYGKLQSCTNAQGQNIVYTYNSSGQRVSKKVGSVVEFYVRDASGNTMATYKKDATINSNDLTATGFYKYGSSLLDVMDAKINVEHPIASTGSSTKERGNDNYILADGNGNTRATIKDTKTQVPDPANPTKVLYYTANVSTATFSSTYGANAKTFNGGFEAANFNGQRKSLEIGADAQTALYWEYNGDVGRRANVDPVVKPWESPYLCFSGNPILLSDLDGNDANDAGVKHKEKSTVKHPTNLAEVVVKTKVKPLSKLPNLEGDYSAAITKDLNSLGQIAQGQILGKVLPERVLKALKPFNEEEKAEKSLKIMQGLMENKSGNRFPSAYLLSTIISGLGGEGGPAGIGAQILLDEEDKAQRGIEEDVLKHEQFDPNKSNATIYANVNTLIDGYNKHYDKKDGFSRFWVTKETLLKIISGQGVTLGTLKNSTYPGMYNGGQQIFYSYMLYMKRTELVNPVIAIENIGYLPTGAKPENGVKVK